MTPTFDDDGSVSMEYDLEAGARNRQDKMAAQFPDEYPTWDELDERTQNVLCNQLNEDLQVALVGWEPEPEQDVYENVRSAVEAVFSTTVGEMPELTPELFIEGFHAIFDRIAYDPESGGVYLLTTFKTVDAAERFGTSLCQLAHGSPPVRP